MPDTVEVMKRVPGMPFEEYAAVPALSYSGMRDLAVSPLRFWYRHINPDRPPDEPTKEMILGTALHCAVLEPAAFDDRYAREIDEADFGECLRTMDDLREFIRSRGQTPHGKLKAALIYQAQLIDGCPAILDVELERFAVESAGKTILTRDEHLRVAGAARALAEEPEIIRILENGEPEVCYFVTDPDTGVPLKCRADWVTAALTADLKTFAQMRGKSIDRSVADAIWYEGYHRQAWMYTYIRKLAEGKAYPFVFAFAESDQPHETRLRKFEPSVHGQASLLWQRAGIDCLSLMQTYAECMREFGTKPWHWAQPITLVTDEEMPGALSY